MRCSASDSVSLILNRSYHPTLLITNPTRTPLLMKTSLKRDQESSLFGQLFTRLLPTGLLCSSRWSVRASPGISHMHQWCSSVTKSVKIDQSECIPDPGIPEWPFVKFVRRSFASFTPTPPPPPPPPFFLFPRCPTTN